MKKLMFATALVASVAAFADPINAISFEGYTTLPYTFVNGAEELDETGTSKAPDGPYFYYDGEQDGSSVKAFGGEGNAVAPNITRPLAFANASPNANYLDLSTEGGILWRSINNITKTVGETTTYDLGTAANVTSEGLYLDTLVQFTPTEDGGSGTPDLTSEDKLAIWLNVDSTATPSTTNLMVRAAIVGDETRTPATFTITNKAVVAGAWYRLTVKAIDDIAGGEHLPGFQIYLDGTLLMSDTITLESEYFSLLTTDYEEDIANGAVFASLKGFSSTPTLQGVGFKGSGALDDIVWTTEDPFASSGVDYQVTIGDSVVPITLSSEDVTALGTAILAAGITGTDLSTPAGVNAALAGTIGSSGIPVWQAFFLGLPLTEDGLESFKITSISFDEDGKVVVTVPASVTLLTGHGVNIVLSLQGSGDLSSWSEVETATITNDKPSFAPVTPGDATKKFYKIVVNFVQTPVVQGS